LLKNGIIKRNKKYKQKILQKKHQYHYGAKNTPQITIGKMVAQHNATKMEQNLQNNNTKLCKQVDNKRYDNIVGTKEYENFQSHQLIGLLYKRKRGKAILLKNKVSIKI
jgi:hypothetical protein